MNCLIVDDDEMTRIDLEQKIGHTPFLRLVGSCSSAMEAAELMSRQPVDLLFLDIQMPSMNGLQMLEMLKNERPLVVLVTSDPGYAVDAFNYDVTDFLVKPVTEERFLKAVLKARRLQEARPSSWRSNQLFAKVNNGWIKIESIDILYIEALADYINIHTPAQRYTVHATMKSMENTLPQTDFFRVHNSFIVRLDKIARIEDNMVIIGQKPIPVSRSKVKPLMQRLNLI